MFPETAKGIAVMGTPGLTELVHGVAARANQALDVRALFCASSDYLSFMLQGVPAARPRISTTASHLPHAHAFDTPAQLPAEWLTANVAAFAPLLLHLLGGRCRDNHAGQRRKRRLWFAGAGAADVHRILSAPVPGG